jgi:hypothetical protein
MSEGSKWTPGKIFLLVIAILAGLGLLCCGGVYAFWGDEIMSGVYFGTNSGKFVQRLQADYGQTAVFGVEPDAQHEFVLTIGVEGDLTPERVREVQDGAWKIVGEVFGKDGFLPVKRLAVGKPLTSSMGQQGAVVDWADNIVSVEELTARTGVPAPPRVKFLPKDLGKGRVKVTTGTNVKIETTSEEGGGADAEQK